MKKTSLIIAAPMIAAFYSAGAVALPSVTAAFTTGQQQWSDDSAEILLDNDSNGVLSVGDDLVGILGITSFPTSNTAANSVNEMTAVFATRITAVSAALPSLVCAPAPYAGTCNAFTFGPTGNFNAAVAAANAIVGSTIGPYLDPLGNALGVDTVWLFLEDSTPDFNRDGGTQANAFNTGGDGDVRMSVELNAANSDGWTGTGPLNLLDFLTVPSGTGLGSFSIDATIAVQNYAGWIFDPQISANGSIKPTTTSAFVITDDTTFEVNAARVPEPASIALLSLGLLGMGARIRKSRK